MNNEERQVIGGIFERLKQVEAQPRDPEAERFIAERIAAQPYAPYAMAQTIYVQEQALENLQRQIEDLQTQLSQMENRPQGGGLLASIFGGGNRQVEPAMPARSAGLAAQPPAPMGAPSAGAPPAGPWGQRQGGGFLAGAMTTAAGVAGGMLVGSALSNAFGLNGAKDAAPAEQAAAPAEEPQAEAQPASYDEAADDGGFDFGGGDEWV